MVSSLRLHSKLSNSSFITLKTRSLFTLMALSLFAISFTMISDAQTAYGIEIFPVNDAVDEVGFNEIAIADVLVNENNVYLLYFDVGIQNFLRITCSDDMGDNWSDPFQLETGLDDFAIITSEHIFINDLGHVGVSWEDAYDPVEIGFAVSTDNCVTFGDSVYFEGELEGFGLELEDSGKVSWSGDGDTVAFTFSDGVGAQVVVVSTDFGEEDSWNDPVVIQSEETDHDGEDGPDGIAGQSDGIIVVNGNDIFATWKAENGGAHAFFAKSTDSGATWDLPIQLSDDPLGDVSPKMILNEDGDEVLISWIGESDEIIQAVITVDDNTFELTELDISSLCEPEYDIDNLGEGVIFMCKGADDASERLVKVSSDFGQDYPTEFTTLSGGDVGISSSAFPDNIGTNDILYSLWEENDDGTPKFLSHSPDNGETFNFDSLPTELDDAVLENGILSQQAVFDNSWYWFVQTDSTTISFVKVLASPIDHYLGYDAKVKHDDHDDDKEDKKGKGHDNHKDKENGKGHEKYDDNDDHEKNQVTLIDAFEGEAKYDVKKLEMLFNPVNKTLADGEEDVGGINLPESHLVAYDIKKSKGEPKFEGIKNIHVTNQFGNITIDIKKAKMLLVPSNKTHDIVPTELEDIVINHFKCYDSKVSKHTSEFEKRTVDLKDQFIINPITMEVKKIEMFCSPVDKNNEEAVNDENYLMCYDLKKIKGEPKFKKMNVFINNQFGLEELKVKKPNLLCVPSTIVEPPVCEDDQVLDTETNTCVAPEFGLCGEGTTLIDDVCTIDETKRVHKHIHKHIHKHVHSYDSSYSEHEQESDPSYSEHEQESDPSYSEHEQESEQGPELFSGSFIGKHKDNGTWKTTGVYIIDDDKYRKVKTTGAFSIETIDECKQISASSTIKFRNGDVNANFDLQKCDNSPKYIGTFVITGGTGEYEGATGSGGVTMQGSMKHFKGYLNGEISIPT